MTPTVSSLKLTANALEKSWLEDVLLSLWLSAYVVFAQKRADELHFSQMPLPHRIHVYLPTCRADF